MKKRNIIICFILGILLILSAFIFIKFNSKNKDNKEIKKIIKYDCPERNSSVTYYGKKGYDDNGKYLGKKETTFGYKFEVNADNEIVNGVYYIKNKFDTQYGFDHYACSNDEDYIREDDKKNLIILIYKDDISPVQNNYMNDVNTYISKLEEAGYICTQKS